MGPYTPRQSLQGQQGVDLVLVTPALVSRMPPEVMWLLGAQGDCHDAVTHTETAQEAPWIRPLE